MSNTDKFRLLFVSLWVLTVLCALVGWMFFAKDPAQLAPVIGWVTAGVFTGEAANVGKRATWKREAVE